MKNHDWMLGIIMLMVVSAGLIIPITYNYDLYNQDKEFKKEGLRPS
jgi:hypothetical protein